MSDADNMRPRVAASPDLQERKALVVVRFAHTINRSGALFGLVLVGAPRLLCLLMFGSGAIAADRPRILFILGYDVGWGNSRAYEPNSGVDLPAIEHRSSEGAD